MLPDALYSLMLFVCLAVLIFVSVPLIARRIRHRESPISSQIKRHLDPSQYWCISDVAIRTRELTVIVDHIIVSAFGIFIVQERDFIGTVEGQANHSLWVSKRLSKERRFQNPLVNNRESLALLKSCYGHTDNLYHSLVVFSGKGKFKNAMPGNVRTEHDFIDYIKSKKEQIMLPGEAKLIKEQIESGKIPNTLKTYSQYLDHAKALYKEYTQTKINHLEKSHDKKKQAPALKGQKPGSNNIQNKTMSV